MGQKVHRGQDGRRWYLCPGCTNIHELPTCGWDGNATAPTSTHPVLIRTFDGHDTVDVCHAVLANGTARFMRDSTQRAGETLPLPDWPLNLSI